ncbi:hypothetical protein PHMEG_00022380, partial [Phytophthora megakarya]
MREHEKEVLRTKVPDVLYIVLERMGYPARWREQIRRFGRSGSNLSSIFFTLCVNTFLLDVLLCLEATGTESVPGLKTFPLRCELKCTSSLSKLDEIISRDRRFRGYLLYGDHAYGQTNVFASQFDKIDATDEGLP